MKKFIQNYPNYQIDDCGIIYLKNGAIKKDSSDSKGYKHITLSNNGIKKSFLVHRLVAIHFIENPLNKPQVNHIDGDKTNNNVVNLEWCNPSENIQHSFSNRLSNYKGCKNGKAKLSENQVKEIKILIQQKIKLKDIASQYNVHPNTISQIKRGVRWGHIN